MSGTITPGGPAVTVTTATPGETVQLTFAGASGQRIFVKFTNNTINANCCNQARAYITKPDGTNLALGTQIDSSPYGGVYFYNNSVVDTVTLPTAGTYTLVLVPTATEAGSATVTMYDVPADPAATVTPASGSGSAVALTTTTPGQNISVVFPASANQRLFVKFTGNTINANCCNQSRAYIIKPDGTSLALGTQIDSSPYGGVYFYNNSVVDTVTLPVSGTYTLVADPDRAKTGGVTVTVYDVPADPTGTLLDDVPLDLTTTTPGQNLAATFSGTSGEIIDVDFTNNTINPSCCNPSKAWILAQDGTKVALGTQENGAGSDTVYFFDGSAAVSVALPADGTYTVVADPDRAKTGNVTVTFNDPPPVDKAYYVNYPYNGDPGIDPTSNAYDLGCLQGQFDASHHNADSLVVLDFGTQNTADTGTLLPLNNTPVSYANIKAYARNFAVGYWDCTGLDLESRMYLAIGTNNSVPSVVDAAHGASWADVVKAIHAQVISDGVNTQVTIRGANDIEPGWSTQSKAVAWAQAYDANTTIPYDNYGSCDGCPSTATTGNGYSFVPCPGCQYSWNQLGIWQVSYGLATALPLPEIYLSSWANQWAAISYYGVIAHQYKVVFDGPMDEHPRDTSTLTATAAWRKLRVALRGFGGTINQTPPWRSEIQGTGT